MGYHPGYAYFADPIDLRTIVRALVDRLDPQFRLILEQPGDGADQCFAQLPDAAPWLTQATTPIRTFILILPIQYIEGRLTPGGYLAFDMHDFDSEWYDTYDPTLPDIQTKCALAEALLVALVQAAGARLAYISGASDHYAGDVTPDAQSEEVFWALAAADDAAVSRVLWASEGPVPWLLAHNQDDPLGPAMVADRAASRYDRTTDGVRVLEEWGQGFSGYYAVL